MDIFNDINIALRSMFRNYKFTLLTIFVMTLGLSLFIFMFAFLYNTVVAPLPFDGGERVRSINSERATFRVNDFEYLKENQQSFEVFDAWRSIVPNVATSDRIVKTRGLKVTPTFFKVSEGKPMLGRLFSSEDTQPGAEPVTLISETLWSQLFASDPDIVGKKLRIENQLHTIIGVMPASFAFPQKKDLYLPYDLISSEINRANADRVFVYGRLKPNVSDDMANKELNQIMEVLAKQYPKINANTVARVITLQENTLGFYQNLITPMQLCVALIFLLACVNTGNLLFSRALEKNKETAIRSALGAPRARLIAQMMMENFFICLLSGSLALLLANWGIRVGLTELSASFLNAEAPFWWQLHLTKESVILGIVITIVTALVTGFLPAWKATSESFCNRLTDGTRGARSRSFGRLSRAIVIVEVALSCALLFPSATIVYTVFEKSQQDYGAKLDGYYAAIIDVRNANLGSNEAALRYYHHLEERLEQQPNIDAVSYTEMLPLTWNRTNEISIEGVDYGAQAIYPKIALVPASHDYFDTVNIKLHQGRIFDSRDKLGSPRTAIVTQNFVENNLPDESPIGKRFKIMNSESEWYTIVGVVNNVVHGGPTKASIDMPSIFVSHEQQPVNFVNIVIKSTQNANEVSDTLSRIMFQINPDIAPFRFRTIERLMKRTFAYLHFLGGIFLSFTVISIIVAFSGIYGVMSNAIVQRTQEVGIRRALGADDRQIHAHFLKQSSKQLLFGILLGLPPGIALFNMISDSKMLLMSLSMFILIPLIVSFIVYLAVRFPVAKTLKMQPSLALRYE